MNRELVSALMGNKRLLVWLGAAAFLAAALMASSIRSRHLGLLADLEMKKEQYSLYAGMLEKEDEVAGLLGSGGSALDALEKKLIKADDAVIGAARLQEAFKSFAAKRGANIMYQKSLPATELSGYTKISIEFELTAELSQLVGLLEDLRNAPEIIGIREMTIKKDEAGTRLLKAGFVIESALKSAGGDHIGS